MRDPQVYHWPRSTPTSDRNCVLTVEEFWRRAEPHVNEPNRDYVVRAARLVNDGTAFLFEVDHPEMSKRNWRVPFWKNYLLSSSRRVLFLYRWARGRVRWSDPNPVYRYVYSDYHRAIERGVGKCDQQAVILMGLLKKRGIATHYVSCPSHVLVEAEVEPGVWWVLDPSESTVLAYDVATLCKQPGLIRPACLAQGTSLKVAEFLEANLSNVSDPPTMVNSVKSAHGPAHYYFEFASWYLIWIIPGLMLATGIVGLRKLSNRNVPNTASELPTQRNESMTVDRGPC
jgi:hypothetical protein